MTNTLDYKILILFATIFLAIILLPLMVNRMSKHSVKMPCLKFLNE